MELIAFVYMLLLLLFFFCFLQRAIRRMARCKKKKHSPTTSSGVLMRRDSICTSACLLDIVHSTDHNQHSLRKKDVLYSQLNWIRTLI